MSNHYVNKPTISSSNIFSNISRIFGRQSSSIKSEGKTLYDFKVIDIKGNDLDMNALKGKVVLVVNVASKCGFTAKNYEQLKEFDEKYYDKGLRILLFPCNQFGRQEPGDNESVCHFIGGISGRFIVTQKIDVNGSNAHPIFQWLQESCPGFLFNAIKWNFTKFLINRNGEPVKRFAPNDEPKSFESEVEKLIN